MMLFIGNYAQRSHFSVLKMIDVSSTGRTVPSSSPNKACGSPHGFCVLFTKECEWGKLRGRNVTVYLGENRLVLCGVVDDTVIP